MTRLIYAARFKDWTNALWTTAHGKRTVVKTDAATLRQVLKR